MTSIAGDAPDGLRFGPMVGRPLLVRGETLTLDVDPRSRSGGPKTWRTSIEDAAARVTDQSSAAAQVLASTPAEYLGEYPILKIELTADALAASWYPKRLFQECGFVHVGSTVRNDVRTVFVAIPDDGLQTLQQIAQQAPTAIKAIKDGIQALDTISLAQAATREQLTVLSGGDEDLVEIVLHGQPDDRGVAAPAGAATIDSVAALVSASGGTVVDEWIGSSDTATFVPARIGAEGLAELRRHNAIRVCGPMAQLRPLPSPIPSEELPLAFGFSGPPPPSNVPPLKVAVFDGGVDADSPVWQGRVTGCEIGCPAPIPDSSAHGALVTSAMLYGHLGGSHVLPPPANLDITHYTAIPQSGREHDLQMYWLLDTMAKVLRDNDFDVVLVCIGPDLLVTDDHIDRWTSTIDQLWFEHDVLFVVAAGNNGELDAASRMNRILVPADTVNGLAVGATDRPTGTAGASYSAKGPGRTRGQIVPTGVAFGGSRSEPFVAVDNDGTRLLFQGTSCAAPLVVNGLAKAATRLGLKYRTATVLKCCAIHFADTARGQNPDDVGYGHLPSDYPQIDYSEAHIAHVLFEGCTARDATDVYSVPMPDGMPPRADLRITVVSTSEVNSGDAGDYTAAGLVITLRPDATLYTFTSPTDEKTTRSLSLTRDAQTVAALQAEGWTRAEHPVSKSWTVHNKTEAELRARGKWESAQVITHQVRTPMVEPRIELKHLSRQDAQLTAATPPLQWTMLISLTGPPGTELNQTVQVQFPSLQPHVITIEPDVEPDIEAGG
jgi:hypothetical protein